MRIGSARRCLTPDKEFYLIGFRSPNRMEPAAGVHDDIYSNALLFEQGGQHVFVCSADFLEFEEEMAEDVKTLLQDKFGIERDLVLLSATHNHSSVVSYHKSWYTQKFDPAYYEFLLQTIVDSYQECLDNLREATAKCGKEIVKGYFGNRNHPGELADNEVIVVKFYDEAGQAFAGLVNWAVHSTVISAGNDMLTSELAGEVSKKLGEKYGFYPAMIVGAAGDCSNRNERQGKDFNELERVSSALADIIGDIATEQEVMLGEIEYLTLFHTVHHDMKKILEEIHEEMDKAMKALAKETDPEKRKDHQFIINHLKEKQEGDRFHLDAKCSVIRLGEMQMFVFPGELGSAFGIEMKEKCNGLGLVFGYTNGYYEYFMPTEEYGLSHETIGCRVPRGEAEKLIQKFIQASRYLSV